MDKPNPKKVLCELVDLRTGNVFNLGDIIDSEYWSLDFKSKTIFANGYELTLPPTFFEVSYNKYKDTPSFLGEDIDDYKKRIRESK